MNALAVILTDGGEADIVRIPTDLKSLQRLVGGDLEMVTLDGEAHLYINENGKCDGKRQQWNYWASLLVDSYRPGFIKIDSIVGTAIVLGSTADGQEADVPDSVRNTMRRLSIADI